MSELRALLAIYKAVLQDPKYHQIKAKATRRLERPDLIGAGDAEASGRGGRGESDKSPRKSWLDLEADGERDGERARRPKTSETWSACDFCGKWRRLSAAPRGNFLCANNPDARWSSCEVGQELQDDEIDRRLGLVAKGKKRVAERLGGSGRSKRTRRPPPEWREAEESRSEEGEPALVEEGLFEVYGEGFMDEEEGVDDDDDDDDDEEDERVEAAAVEAVAAVAAADVAVVVVDGEDEEEDAVEAEAVVVVGEEGEEGEEDVEGEVTVDGEAEEDSDPDPDWDQNQDPDQVQDLEYLVDA